ncbi:hypothetical protein [Paenibacillus wynnii]|uniref:Uncharacterized protein n=1 Tax=Paenibacillus wynnii TaxID=268407 RepID=A0A098MGL1_9BACL|nr:hypothetical protein [Paenibacillus wynnii]KGE20677.1 hypothetical protein PWYN_00300 [Paenibacillus wynnii]
MDSSTIKIERSDKFNEIAFELSNLISSLPTSSEQNNKLILLMIEQIEQAEKDAFEQGMLLGIKLKEVSLV